MSLSRNIKPLIPWVLNFPPCRGPGGSIPTWNVASLVSSNCPLWEERRGNTTRLPWVASRKPDEGVLEVEDYRKFSASGAQHTSLAWISVRRVVVRSGTINRLVAPSPKNNLLLSLPCLLYQPEYTPFAHNLFHNFSISRRRRLNGPIVQLLACTSIPSVYL